MHFILITACKFIFLIFFITACDQNKTIAERSIIFDSTQSKEINDFVSGDQSSMDMSYFPTGYPLQKMSGKDSAGMPLARVIYSRPHKKGRQIFGDTEGSLCRYGKEWRLGANEATEIEFFKNVTIAGKALPKGRYVMYCIPFADRWTIIFNRNLYTWGLHMEPSKDIFKTDIPTMALTPSLEDFTMVFISKPSGADLLMAWENVKTSLPIDFSK